MKITMSGALALLVASAAFAEHAYIDYDADDGTGEGVILYVRNIPGDCGAVPPEFEAEFHAAFERFIESIRSAS